MIVFVGAHYQIIMRNPQLKEDRYYNKKWVIYNDLEVIEYSTWYDILSVLIDSSALPTLLIY